MDPLQAGIAAARDGRRAEARDLLKVALQADPFSERGWLWMSVVVETDLERRVCLERVLDINPRNQTAQETLNRLSSSEPPSPHHMATLAMEPVAPSPSPVQRLAPQAEPPDDLARLRASQFQTASGPDETSFQEADSFTALVLIGGLSITAIAGALMLGLLWLIGWPP